VKKQYKYILLTLVVLLILVTLYHIPREEIVIIEEYSNVQRLPVIRPDYIGTVIPPNIAPLNFIIEEPGTHYYVKIHSTRGEAIKVYSKTSKIIIPLARWKKLLNANHNQKLNFDVYIKETNGKWKRFETITNTITDDEIDGYLVYRLLNVQYNFSKNLSIIQRNIQKYDESLLINSRSFEYGCLNCHTFLNNNPNNMIIHIRGKPSGSRMLLIQNGEVLNVASTTRFGSRPAAYSSWHPSGKLLAFSFNKVCQFFHTSRSATRDGLDHNSGLAFFDIDSKTIWYESSLSDPDWLETYPTWSPDGKYLYFSSAPLLWHPDSEEVPPDRFEENRYDLKRISYNLESGKFGEIETVLSAEETGLSILEPRVSPDGRFLLFCMMTYGCFPTLNPTSDIYLMNLKTGDYKCLPFNSDKSESWHSWSSSSRWFVFSSKKGDGLFMKPYFSYIDENGTCYKPFLLPQKDPAFYDSFYKIFQLPELIKEPIPMKKRELLRAIYSPIIIEGEQTVTSATPQKTSATPQKSSKPITKPKTIE